MHNEIAPYRGPADIGGARPVAGSAATVSPERRPLAVMVASSGPESGSHVLRRRQRRSNGAGVPSMQQRPGLGSHGSPPAARSTLAQSQFEVAAGRMKFQESLITTSHWKTCPRGKVTFPSPFQECHGAGLDWVGGRNPFVYPNAPALNLPTKVAFRCVRRASSLSPFL